MKATQSGWRGLSSSSPCPSCLTPNFIFLISAMGLMPEEMREATCPRGSPQRVCEGSAGLTGARQPPAFPLRVRRRGTCLGRALRAGRAPALGSTIQAPWAGGAGGPFQTRCPRGALLLGCPPLLAPFLLLRVALCGLIPRPFTSSLPSFFVCPASEPSLPNPRVQTPKLNVGET